eukprot:8761701-Pyramimonas_sp.AAC.1
MEFPVLQQLPGAMISLLSNRLSTRIWRLYMESQCSAPTWATVPAASAGPTHVSKSSHAIPLGPMYPTVK